MNLLGSPFAPGVYQFLDDDGAPVAGGKLYSYVSGTSTPLDTYADPAYSATNTNPIILTAEGVATVFLKPNNADAGQAYDFVVKTAADVFVRNYDKQTPLAPSTSANLISAVVGFGSATTLTISGGVITPTKNVHLVSPESGAVDNLDTIMTSGLPDGALLTISNTNGAAAITVRSGAGNISLAGAANYELDTTVLRLTLLRYGPNWYEIGRTSAPSPLSGSTASSDGRLTLTTGTPVTVTDVTAATTVYYTPYVGNAIDLYNSTDGVWQRFTFSELSLAVPATTNTNYDVFAQSNAGTVQLAFGSAWTNLTTRTNGLTRQNGVLVYAPNTISRYLGTISTTGVSGQTEDSLTKRYVWNYYHRVNRPLQVRDATATWTYSTDTWRQANGSVANQVASVIGVAEDAMVLTLRSMVSSSVNGLYAASGIGIDSTTVPETTAIGQITTTALLDDLLIAVVTLTTIPGLGRRAYTWLERGNVTAATFTWHGVPQSGLSGMVRG